MLPGMPSDQHRDSAEVGAPGQAVDMVVPRIRRRSCTPAFKAPHRQGHVRIRHSLGSCLLFIFVFCAGETRHAQVASPDKQTPTAQAVPDLQLSEEEMRQFLLTAKVIKNKSAGKGITNVHRLTLSDGKITHDAAFQAIDETRPRMEFANGRVEMNFRDSYKYDIAAYELARLVGLGDMMPVTVKRSWDGKPGALSWWLPVMMDEAQRLKKKLEPPEPETWNKQIHKMRVFAQLVYDTDRNLGNVLISPTWHLWMIDFSRAFRIYHELENAKNLERCDRELLDHLRRLDATEVKTKTEPFLSKPEIDGVMARRDIIVKLFQKLMDQKGEAEVLY